MKIESIAIQNFLGLPDFRHTLKHPFLLIAGTNGAGKSSLQDGIRFALTGALARDVRLVKDRNKLITDGAASGYAEVVVDGYKIRRNIGSGATTKDELPESPNLPFSLDTSRFAACGEDDRRRVLFELSGVQISGKVVGELMANQEPPIGEEYISQVLPLLRGGFPDAAKAAAENATKARGAWKAITGETYGSLKGASWTAQSSSAAPTAAEWEGTRRAVERAQQAVAELTEAKGRAEASLTPTRRKELEALAASVDDLSKAADEACTAMEDAIRERDELTAEARGNSGITAPCPCCKEIILIQDGNTLRKLTAGKHAPAKAAAKIKSAQADVEEATRRYGRASAAVIDARAAVMTVEHLPDLDPNDFAAAEKLEEARRVLAVHQGALRALEDAQRAANECHGQTERALAEHERVAAWTQTAAALSPDGIPAVLLARALDPINDALSDEALRAGWKPPAIARDLSLTYAGRPYALCSESEQWRADTLFSAVITIMANTRVLSLDRFDVLDPAARADAVDYLDTLLQRDAVDTIIACGTFKAPPSLDGIDVVWLQDGSIAEAA